MTAEPALLLVLEEMRGGKAFVEPSDVADLLKEAGFLLSKQDGPFWLYRHRDSEEEVFLRFDCLVHPGQAPTIADIISNYWP